MKKQLIVLFILVAISVISFTSCEPFIENKIIAKNLAAGDVQLNIRGQAYEVPAGQTVVINDFKKGTFEYSTIYSIPADATDFSEEGDVSGTMVFNAGTEISVTYTSTFIDNSYTLYGVLVTSDDVNRTDPSLDDGTP